VAWFATKGLSVGARLTILAVLSVVSMHVDHRQRSLGGFDVAQLIAAAPVHYLVNFPFVAGRWISEELASRRALREENARLHAEHLLLQARLQQLDALQVENQRLLGLLQSASRLTEPMLIAELLAVDPDPFSHQVVINKGSRDGVYLGQPLLAAEGVFGQVVQVGPFTSRVLLITDSSHAIPVQVNRNGVRAIATGNGSNRNLTLANVPDTADIRVGDLLVSSGLGGRFPAGYPVGRVSHIELDPAQHYAQINVQPAALVDRSREVLLVWPDKTRAETFARAQSELEPTQGAAKNP
jgi:rod shape-determining protein MreC